MLLQGSLVGCKEGRYVWISYRFDPVNPNYQNATMIVVTRELHCPGKSNSTSLPSSGQVKHGTDPNSN